MAGWDEILRWQFAGLLYDQWPKHDEFQAAYERATHERTGGVARQFDDPEVDRLRSEYWGWRERLELDALNAYGASGYELVSYQRDDKGNIPVFKRQKRDDALAVPETRLPGLDRLN